MRPGRVRHARSELHAEAAAILTDAQADGAAKVHGALRDFLVARVDAFLRLVGALL